MDKITALANFLQEKNISEGDIEDKGDGFFMVDGDEQFYVYTDEEANQKVKDAVKNRLWTIEPDFIHKYIDKDIIKWDMRAGSIAHMQKIYDEGNPAIEMWIGKNIDKFVHDIVELKGRGYFLSLALIEDFYEGYYIY